MKKLLIISAFCLPMAVMSEEINGVKVPEWRDFVPPAYVDVEAPKGIGKLNETAKYWYKRRIEFEEGMDKCRALEQDEAKYSCFQSLKVKKYQKNTYYNARL